MAYLGRDGIIRFQRVPPEPVVVPINAVNILNDYITVDYDDWLLGELVHLVYSGGYIQGYIHRNELNRISFHSTVTGALSNTASTRLSLAEVAITKPVVLAANINATQLASLITFQTTLTTATTVETLLRAWPNTANSIKSQATSNPWNIQGQVERWEFQRTGPEVDTSVIGDKFNKSIKSTVSGSGSIDFIVSLYSRNNYSDVDPLIRLIQLTEQGSSAQMKLYIKKSSDPGTRVDELGSTNYIQAAIYFYISALITNCAISTSPDEIIKGSADFVTTGPIRLLSE